MFGSERQRLEVANLRGREMGDRQRGGKESVKILQFS